MSFGGMFTYGLGSWNGKTGYSPPVGGNTFGSENPLPVNSNPNPYITASEFFDFTDPDLPANTLSDTPGLKISISDLIDPVTDGGKRLNSILLAASGRLESACLVGKRYSTETLAGLTGSSSLRMKEIISDLATFRCFSRRDGSMPPENVVYRYQEAEKALEQLAHGEKIFSVNDNQAAGLPISEELTSRNLQDQNLLSVSWERAFGQRQESRRWRF